MTAPQRLKHAQVFAKGVKRFEAEVRVIYFQGGIKPRAANTGFVVCILVNSADRTFTDGDELILNADGETISAAKGQRFWRQNSYGAQEMMQHRIGRSDLAKIANAKKVSLTAGSFTGSVGRDLQVLVRELLELAG